VEKLVAPPAIAACRRLRRFHQQEPQQAVALFTDMAQPPSFPAGVFLWDQSQIAGDLLATVEAIGFPDDQHKGDCGQSTHPGMSHQASSCATFLRLLLDRPRQLGDRRVNAVQRLQQIFPPATCPGSQRQ
jgi:hypothetical protein